MATVYQRPPTLRQLANFIFWTRWLQAPLYVGLIVAQGVYVYHFWLELVHLVQAMFGNEEALPDERRTDLILALCRMGYADWLLLSHDHLVVGQGRHERHLAAMRERMPKWRLRHLPSMGIPDLLGAGISPAEIKQMTINNPADFLTSAAG